MSGLRREAPGPAPGPSEPDPGPIEGESGEYAEPRSGLRDGTCDSGVKCLERGDLLSIDESGTRGILGMRKERPVSPVVSSDGNR